MISSRKALERGTLGCIWMQSGLRFAAGGCAPAIDLDSGLGRHFVSAKPHRLLVLTLIPPHVQIIPPSLPTTHDHDHINSNGSSTASTRIRRSATRLQESRRGIGIRGYVVAFALQNVHLLTCLPDTRSLLPEGGESQGAMFRRTCSTPVSLLVQGAP